MSNNDEQDKLLNLPFSMVIEDVFVIQRKGIAIIGRVQTGCARKGDEILIVGKDMSIPTRIVSFEGFIRDPDAYVAWAGDNVAILIGDVDRDAIEAGMIVVSV